MHQPKDAHLQVAFRIVQYLKGTLGRRILFKRNKLWIGGHLLDTALSLVETQ